MVNSLVTSLPVGTQIALNSSNQGPVQAVVDVGGAGGVTSIFGRTGAVVAQSGDYTASQITNTSTRVPGANVAAALDDLFVTYNMPLPNGTDDSAAFAAQLAKAAVTGGVIQFRQGVYKSPTGFFLDHVNGVVLRGYGISGAGVIGTTLVRTGARAVDSSTVKMISCAGCGVRDMNIASTASGAENGVLIGTDGATDSVLCYVDNCNFFGNAAAVPVATSATSVNLTTAAGVPQAITLNAVTVPYVAGTKVLIASRGGNGMAWGNVVSLVGNVLTFTPIDTFGAGAQTDWDVLQAYDAVYIAGSEFCAVSRSLATLCYNSFRLGGVASYSDPSNGTSSPIGPSFRSDTSASYIKLFGNAEVNITYNWTVALYANGVLNFEASIGIGDAYGKGIPFVLRSIQNGFVHGLNCATATGSVFAMSMEACSAVNVDGFAASIPSGAFINNIASNSQCRATTLYPGVGGMLTFGSANFLGFVEWYDVSLAQLNFNFATMQFLTLRFGYCFPSVDMPLANGKNNNVSLSSGTQRITGPTGAFGLTGNPPAANGQRVTFYYTGTQIMTLYHNDAGSPAGNRYRCPTGADVVLLPVAGGFISYDLLYSSSDACWLVILPR